MRRQLVIQFGFIAACLLCQSARADSEISLFAGNGEPQAYVAVDDEMTIYLWSGRPVAYLDPQGSGTFAIYGFNGKHLGWFEKGVIWNHDGTGSCATKDVLTSPQFEPFKAFKQFKPFKAFKEYAPIKPSFVRQFGEPRCDLLLASGGS